MESVHLKYLVVSRTIAQMKFVSCPSRCAKARVVDPFIGALLKQKGIHRSRIVVRRQLVRMGGAHANEGLQSLSGQRNALQEFAIVLIVMAIILPLVSQQPRQIRSVLAFFGGMGGRGSGVV